MMFEKSDKPRVFGMPPGCDFASALVQGIVERSQGLLPHEFAKVEIYVNTRRMQRRIREVFDSGPARLLPKVRLITDLAQDPLTADIPQPVPSLRRRLEISQLVASLIESQPDIAPKSAVFDLSTSLAALLDEMQGEGVDPDAISSLDVSDSSGHWARTQAFVDIVRRYLNDQTTPDTEARQRLIVERLAADWEHNPPQHPIIIAGSTGSRGATALFIKTVSNLPQGAIVLPGFDENMPSEIWSGMVDPLIYEDHPQYRFKKLFDDLDITHQDVQSWAQVSPPSAQRNAVVSLSLRPAPVTNQWLADGPSLGNLPDAVTGLTLVEAGSPREEAETIALRLRAAVEDNKTAALITPDRVLSRQVAAALDRWHIQPDDSAGQPLHLSPPGRFLRQVAELMATKPNGETLLSLLKHPLTASGSERGSHLRWTRELELSIRRNGPAFPTGDDLIGWANADDGRKEWAAWIAKVLAQLSRVRDCFTAGLPHFVDAHIKIAEGFAAGPNDDGTGELWKEAAGREALSVMKELQLHSDAGGEMSPLEYQMMVGAILRGGEVRNPDSGHPNVLFWGTLEARVQSADLVILAGMNESSWPEAPAPDPWLNRQMRKEAGLLMPERRIGLSAHDYQQAVAAPEVWITRAIRSSEAETVPSRWINRLLNLLEGLPAQNGEQALSDMRERGATWIRKAQKLNEIGETKPAAPRPSPAPPKDARPTSISVTQVQTLIRNPYEIYARKVLGLKALDPIVPGADAPLRGEIIHKILERFIKEDIDPSSDHAKPRLLAITDEELTLQCPWPTTRQLWRARIERAADWFLQTEVDRRQQGTPVAFEAWGELELEGLNFTIGGKADRIDTTPDGQAILYDYKSGSPPTKKQQLHFDKQLLLEAAMVARGAFKAIGAKPALSAEFIGIGAQKIEKAPFDKSDPEQEWAHFRELIIHWQDSNRGFSARMAADSTQRPSDFDHLSRYGEWDLSVEPTTEVLK